MAPKGFSRENTWFSRALSCLNIRLNRFVQIFEWPRRDLNPRHLDLFRFLSISLKCFEIALPCLGKGDLLGERCSHTIKVQCSNQAELRSLFVFWRSSFLFRLLSEATKRSPWLPDQKPAGVFMSYGALNQN